MPTPNQMKIIKHLVTYGNMRKGMVPKNFLTKEEAAFQLSENGRVITHSVCIGDQRFFFFSEDQLFGYKDEKNQLKGVVGRTSHLPMHVTPREWLENGVITNIDQYILVFYHGDSLINDFMELVQFIEKHNLLVTEE